MSQVKAPKSATTCHEVMLEIDSLLDEIARLAKSNCPAEEFFPPVLTRAAFAVAGRGSGLWLADAVGDLQLVYHEGLDHLRKSKTRVGLSALTHDLTAKLKAGVPTIMPSSSSLNDDNLLFAPIEIDARKWGAIVIQIPGEVPQASHDGLLRFTVEVAHLISNYVRRQEATSARQSATEFARYASFSLAAHQYTQKLDVAYEIVNEGRRYVGCDRLALATMGFGSSRIIAVSGAERVSRRTNLIAKLEKLIHAAARTGVPFVYRDGDTDMAPQLEKCLHQYLDESGVRSLAIFPLAPTESPGAKPIGALVFEQFCGDGITELLPKISLASKHAALAWGRAMGATRGRGTNWNSLFAKLAIVALCVAGIGAFLAQPADFEIVVRGQMVPRVERNLFSPAEGFIEEVLVQPGQMVKQGQTLVKINSPDIELQIKRASGDIQTAQKRQASLVAERLQLTRAGQDTAIAESRLTGEELTIKDTLQNLEAQMEILERQRKQLDITAPISGYVMSWELARKLQSRPVSRGNKLLSICNLDGEWVLKFSVPDEAVGHVLAAQQSDNSRLPVRFVTAMAPDEPHQAQLEEIALVSQMTVEDSARAVRVEAVFNREDVSQLVPGATVIGRIYCGERSLAYVWLHEFREEVYRFFF